MSKTKSTAKPAVKQVPAAYYEHFQEMAAHLLARVRAVTQLLENLSDERYECQAAWEEFGMQVEALSDALRARVDALEVHLEGCIVGRTKPAPAAAGGAR